MGIKTLNILKLIILSLLLTSCGQTQPNNKEIKTSQDVIDYCVKNAIAFDFDNTGNSIADEFINVLAPYKVVVVGEIHYVQEHQEMMGNMLKRLHAEGFRYYLQENSTSAGLMIDYYIKGKLNTLTEDEKNFDMILVKELEVFNRILREEGREEEQISYIGFDLNHMQTEYRTALMHLINLHKLPEETFSFYNYNALKIKKAIEEKTIEGLPDDQIEDLKYITEAEIKSAKILSNWDDNSREDFIEDYVLRAIHASKDDEKILLNTGAWHAQLTLHWNVSKDHSFKWLGMRLKEYFKDVPNGLYSFFCNTYKGELRYNLYKPDSFTYEVDEKLKNKLLIPFLMKYYKNQTVFLDFTTVPNNNLPIKIQMPNDLVHLPVNTQFNGMLIYPEVKVPENLKYYESR